MARVRGIPWILGMVLLSGGGSAHPGSGIATDAEGRVYIASGPRILRITPDGAARVIVADAQAERFHQLHHIRRAPDGSLVTASDRGDVLWRFAFDGELSRFYPPPDADRALRVGLGGDPFALDGDGGVIAVNSVQDRFTQLLRVDPEGRITVLAGSDWGFADGAGTAARFRDLHSGSLLAGPDGSVLVTDHRTRVRRVSPSGTVQTVAGGPEAGHRDGPGLAARFDGAAGLALAPDGRILVAESTGWIREISRENVVQTVAGTGASGHRDGPAAQAIFEEPTGIALARDGSVLVYEPARVRVRRIVDGGVTTWFQETPP